LRSSVVIDPVASGDSPGAAPYRSIRSGCRTVVPQTETVPVSEER
jgi:hypothetical protein